MGTPLRASDAVIVNGSEGTVKSACLYFDEVYALAPILRVQQSAALEELTAEGSSNRFLHICEGSEAELEMKSRSGTSSKLSSRRWIIVPYLGRDLSVVEDEASKAMRDREVPFVTAIDITTLAEAKSNDWRSVFVSVPPGPLSEIAYISYNDKAMSSTDAGYACAMLTKVDLVNAASASWEQITEVRSDRQSFQQLRRLRIFMRKQFADSSRTEIEDEVALLMDDYRRAAKRHGLELVQGSIGQVLDSKSIQVTGTAALAMAFMGVDFETTMAAVAATGVAVSVSVGKLALSISKTTASFQWSQQDSPIAYLMHLEDQLR